MNVQMPETSAVTTLRFSGARAMARAEEAAASLKPGLTARMGSQLWMQITACQVIKGNWGFEAAEVHVQYRELTEAERVAMR
jgi:hypothetical protein